MSEKQIKEAVFNIKDTLDCNYDCENCEKTPEKCRQEMRYFLQTIVLKMMGSLKKKKRQDYENLFT